MTRKTKVLSGAAQEAYFRRALTSFPDLSDAASDALLRRLRHDVTQVRVRTAAQEDDVAAREAGPAAGPVVASPDDGAAAAQAENIGLSDDAFDPFALNVLVTLRQQGRDAALEALKAIANADHLRLLAREQRLSIDDALASSTELSTAIVSAAERRLANRRAAANAR